MSSDSLAATGRLSAAGARVTASARELWGWAALAVTALAVAGVFALLIAISRVPGIEAVFPWPIGFFQKGLVIHVVFSFIVWFLAVFGAMAAVSLVEDEAPSPANGLQSNGVRMAALIGAWLAGPLLFVPALLDRGEATLNNYVPTIIDPLYYAGLIVLAAAVAVTAVRLLKGWRSRGPLGLGMAAAAVIYVSALVCFGIAAWGLAGEAPSYAYNEALFWGGGHVLQALNTLLLVLAWAWLAVTVLGRQVADGSLLKTAVAVLLLVGLAGPPLYVLFEPFSADHTDAFTNLQWGLGPPALLVGVPVALAAWSSARSRWREPAFLCLALSPILFIVGAAMGIFVDGADTRTPAHYHGVIAGITLAFMGLYYADFLPRLGRGIVAGAWARAQVWLFACGQLAACIGLFVAGGHGAQRKTAGADQGLDTLAAKIGLGLNGLGGLLAVVGGIIFVVLIGRALFVARGEKIPPHLGRPAL